MSNSNPPPRTSSTSLSTQFGPLPSFTNLNSPISDPSSSPETTKTTSSALTPTQSAPLGPLSTNPTQVTTLPTASELSLSMTSDPKPLLRVATAGGESMKRTGSSGSERSTTDDRSHAVARLKMPDQDRTEWERIALGRHSSDWLFGGHTLTEAVKGVLKRSKSQDGS